jgi:hypothetical protein
MRLGFPLTKSTVEIKLGTTGTGECAPACKLSLVFGSCQEKSTLRDCEIHRHSTVHFGTDKTKYSRNLAEELRPAAGGSKICEPIFATAATLPTCRCPSVQRSVNCPLAQADTAVFKCDGAEISWGRREGSQLPSGLGAKVSCEM